MTSFYCEFWKRCSFSGRRPFNFCDCLGDESSFPNDGGLGNSLALLEALAGEGDLSRLCHALYLKEIRRLNPSLSSGQLFVDGLYELIMQSVSLPSEDKSYAMMNVPSNPLEMFTVYSSSGSTLLLQRYWERPHTSDTEISSYLTIASSFVQYILTTYGPVGVAEFLTQLPCDRSCVEFRFHGNNLVSLEYKWKCFVEAEANSPYRLSFIGMIRDLCQKYYRKNCLKMTLILLCVCLHVGFHLGLAITFSTLLGLGFNEHNMRTVIIWSVSVLGLLLLRFLLINISGYLVTMVTVQVGVDLRKRLARRILQVSFQFFTDHTPGAILSTYSKDVASLESFIAISMTTLLWACLMLCTCIIYATIISLYLGIPLGVAYITSHAFVTWVSSFISRYGFSKAQAVDKSTDLFKEILDGYKENRIYRCALFWLKRVENTLHGQYLPQAIRYNVLTQFVLSFQSIFPHTIGLLLMCGIVLLSAYEWVEFGRGLSVYFMYQLTLMSMASAAGHYSTVQCAKISLGRINALLYNTNHNMIERGNRPLNSNNNDNTLASDLYKSRLSCRGKVGMAIEFDRVCFCYSPTSSHWTLYDLTFKIREGERIALLGESGSGKTTIISLLLQVLRPTTGSVYIAGSETTGQPDGTAVAIFQYNHIFGTTIRENISIGRLNADEDEIQDAAKLAGLHDWIVSLPRGYDTCIRPGTSSLSGGQRQRIAIARMLLSNTPVLLLDEVTSALDPLTSASVFHTLMEATEGRTVLAVTHQVEQAQYFDRIMVLSHGRVKEFGTHIELICQQGLYHKLVLQDKGGVCPSKPTPIRRHHSLTHIVTTPTPKIVVTRPIVGTTPLKTLSEEPSLLRTTIVFETGSREKPIGSLLENSNRSGLLENPFPGQLTVPSSTPYKP